jgi:DNA-binding winged helix-turn-helix (wHTH) protein
MQEPEAMYEFGMFQLDPARFELHCQGKPVAIQPKVLRLLVYLVERRDRAVASEELMRALWPNETVAIGSIKRAVRCARQALGDSGESQATIRTVRGFGYRFVRAVSSRDPANTSPLSAAEAPSADVFVGREEVMLVLSSSVQRALAGSATCVLLSGAPGIGKTRTTEELLTRARGLGMDGWLARCTDVEGVPAYWPFTQLMREAASSRGGAEFRALLGREGADILDAMRELRREVPEMPETTQLSSASARFRLFDGVAVFLQRAAERKPIVIALDDIQCADAGSLRLLSFLVQQVQRARLLIVATHRPAYALQPSAASLIQPLAQSSRVRALELAAWSEPELARYVEVSTGQAPTSELRASLFEATAGNPLFVRQALERSPSLQASAPSQRTEFGAIEQHLALVPEACRELLAAAAVCGAEFSDALLARVAEVALEEVTEQLARAELSGLIQARAGAARYAFTHGLIREALYARLSNTARAALHGRAARAIELHDTGDSTLRLAELTHHYVCAAPLHDAGRALDYVLASAEAARAALAYEQAVEHFERALQLLQYRAPDRVLRAKLQLGRAQALLRSGAREAARAALLDAFALAREAGDVDLRVSAAALFASSPESGSVDETQVSLLDEALSCIAVADPRRSWLEALLAKSLSYAPDATRRVQLARQARARASERSELQLETLTRCHQALLGPDHIAEREQIAASLLELAHERGDAEALLSAFAARIETCAALGDIDGLDAAAFSLESLGEQVRDPVARWHTKVLCCMRATLRGEMKLAREHAEAALHAGTRLDAELARRIYSVQSNLLLRLTGQVAEAEALMRAMALRYPNVYGWTASVGAIDWELGRRAEARSCLLRLIEHGLERVRREPYLLSGLTAISDLCCRVGDADAAQAIYETLLPYGAQHGITHLAAVSYGPMSSYLGLLAECRGQTETAERHFIEALAAAERSRAPLLINNVRVGYARTLLRAGGAARRTQATSLLTQATKHARDKHQHGVAHVCNRIARRHGVALSEAALRA